GLVLSAMLVISRPHAVWQHKYPGKPLTIVAIALSAVRDLEVPNSTHGSATYGFSIGSDRLSQHDMHSEYTIICVGSGHHLVAQ
ncbi:hypothetical protein SK128_006368, partial [Halocaridina rubra]